MDNSTFFKSPVAKADRSRMNVVFRTPSEELDAKFVKASSEAGFANLKGPTLFLDVDVVIMDDIDCFFDYKPGENCIIHNWIEWHKTLFRKRPNIGNSSIYRFEAGKSGYIYDTLIREFDRAHDKSQFPTEQAFLTYAMKKVNWWPYDWAQSYKRCCRPIFPLNLFVAPKPPKTKILVFHGNPDPDQAVVGFFDPQKLLPGDVRRHEISVAEVELSKECTLVHDLAPKK